MVALPKFAPVTEGSVVGVVAPAGIVTEDVSVTAGLSLLNASVTPPTGAAGEMDTGIVVVCPRFSVVVPDIAMLPLTAMNT
jgi:hypothetical protein